MMNSNIHSILIVGLYGIRDYQITFQNNKVILVGENGSGKTTIARITYAVLSCNWDLLRTYPFEKIVLKFDDDSIEITSKMINDIFGIPDIERFEYLSDRHVSGRRYYDGFISSILDVKHQHEKKENSESSLYNAKYRSIYPYEYYSKIIENPNISAIYEITQTIQEKFKSKILYLPTYRRIEEQLKNIFPEVDRDVWSKGRRRVHSERVVELVEFGMDDVERLVKKEQDALRSFSQTQQNKLTLGYLSEIVSKKYDQTSSYTKIRELTDSQIQEVLMRIDSAILSDEMKERVVEILNSVRTEHKHSYSAQVKIVCHYFLQLMSFDQDITRAEQHIRDFQEKCNQYLISNKIIYNSQDFTCQLINKVEEGLNSENSIRFQNLSSGEKQIVSIFSHLYLDKDTSVYVCLRSWR